jgi:S-DNA-T family DNA segregation ATPase FtsK/SpoIIIE
LVDRVKDALVGEQQRRQRILRDAGNIDTVREYQLRRAAGETRPDGRALEALPYLLIIVDEFGELLSGRPDFVDLFVQIGRVGRSLGMHLLLATQRLEEGKLRGLDSNLSYRICLRTFSAAESRTVIGTTDAYRLPPIPGSAYLKVGDSEPERLRVAHVSGPHLSAAQRSAQTLRPPAEIARFRLRVPADVAASAEVAPEERPKPLLTGPSEMRVLVERLCSYGQAAHQVWLPALPDAVPLDALVGPVEVKPGRGLAAVWWPQQGTMSFPVGVLDFPVRQLQHPLVQDFAHEHGHLALVGAPQSGKSTFLRTLMLSAMLTHTPDEVQFLCLDFGGGSLQPFERAPHVSGVAGRHDQQRARRVIAEMHQLISERETLFRGLGLDSAAAFRRLRKDGQLSGVRTADIFLVVDNWGAARGEIEGIEAAVLDIANRGLGVAAHLVLTANRWADLRVSLRDSISGRLELRLNDPSDSEINRRAARQFISAVPGRGMAPPGLQIQVALPRLDGGENVDGLADAQEDAIAKLAAAWSGARQAPPIRMLPERVTVAQLELPPETDPLPGVPIGLNESDLAPVHLDLTGDDPHFLVFGDSGSGKSAFLRTWITGLVERNSPWDVRLIVIDYRKSLLGLVPREHLGAYAGDPVKARDFCVQLAAKLTERLAPADVTPEQLRDRSWWNGPEFYLVVDDYDMVAGRQSPLAPLAEFVPQAREIGLHVVLARRVAGFSRSVVSEPLFTQLKELGADGLILSGDPREGVILGDQRAAQRSPGRGLLVRRKHPEAVVQIAVTE